MKRLICLLLLLFISCNDNNYFYVKDQYVLSCLDKGIYNLSVTSVNDNTSFDINWIDSLHQAPSVINLDSIDKGYKITQYNKWQSKIIANQDFKLTPLKKIKIKRHQGDVVSQEIEIITNEKGEIIKTSKNGCND
jgi:hypothetical protein